MRYIERRHDALGTWVQSLLRRRHSNVVACALARGGEYRAQPSPA
jgi:transposase